MHSERGHEQTGRRPALVLTPQTYNRVASLAILAPITSRRKGYPFEVGLPVKSPVDGVILVDHLKSVDWRARRATFAAKVAPPVMHDVRQLIARLLNV